MIKKRIRNIFRRNLRALLLLCVVLFVTCLTAAGMPPRKKITRNCIHLDAASLFFTGMYSVNYERTLFQSENLTLLSRLGFGECYFKSDSQEHVGTAFPLSLNSLIGRSSGRLEVDFGIRYSVYRVTKGKEPSPFLPVFNLGYRYQQREGKGLVLQGFVGINGVGIGIGKAF